LNKKIHKVGLPEITRLANAHLNWKMLIKQL
jgi:hypothetical protein